MGKKGSWFSTIKRVFVHDSKDKPSLYGSDKRSSKEKKKAGKGILQHGETKSFIPRFRETSSIEKILGEADQLLVRLPESSAETKKIPRAASPPTTSYRATSPTYNVASQRISSARFNSPRPPSPRAALPPALTPEASRWEVRYVQRPEMTVRNQHRSATIIQAAFRGYLARRNFRALRGLVRLQAVVRSSNAERQTLNAMKQMQLLVRVQTQIQSRRVQMLENQHQAYNNGKEMENDLSKWSLNQLHEAGYSSGDWDDSTLTKEEIEERIRKKYEAIMKRERAMAYAYSHQLWKANPRSVQAAPDIRSNGLPWWWNWLERQLPPPTGVDPPIHNMKKNITLTPPRPASEHRTRPEPPRSSRIVRGNFAPESHEAIATPLSTKSMIPSRSRIYNTASKTPVRDVDNDSLSTCPPYGTPNYMTPTASAKAKARASSNPKERQVEAPANETSKRRFSFSLTSNIGAFKWNKGSGKDAAAAQKVTEKQISSHFRGDLSIDSTVSMPATVGRRPFNRFV